MNAKRKALLMLLVVLSALGAGAQCPRGIVRVRGRVENLHHWGTQENDLALEVFLESPKGSFSQRGSVANGEFSVEVPFNTESTAYFPLWGHRCNNRPKVARVKIVAGGQVLTERIFEFSQSFARENSYIYSLKSPLIIDASKTSMPKKE